MTVANPYSAPTAMGTVAGDSTYDPRVFSFNGRIGRLRYLAYGMAWGLVIWAVLAVAGGLFFAAAVNESTVLMGIAGLLLGVVYLGSLVPTFALAVRRLNDLGQSGWLSLLLIVPLVNLAFILYLLFAPGTQGENQYGPPAIANTTAVIVGAVAIPIFLFVVSLIAAAAIPAYMEYAGQAGGTSEYEYIE